MKPRPLLSSTNTRFRQTSCLLVLFTSLILSAQKSGYSKNTSATDDLIETVKNLQDNFNNKIYGYYQQDLIINPEEEIEEIDIDVYKSLHFYMNASDAHILDSAIPFIIKANELFTPQGNDLFKNPDYSLHLSTTQRLRSNIFYAPDIIQIYPTSSYYLDLTYSDYTKCIDDFLFNYNGYRFSTYDFIEPWFKGIENVFEQNDKFIWNDDFFYHYCFEVYCGKIVKAYFISGFEDDIVYDLMTEKEITQEEFRQAMPSRQIILQSMSPGIYGKIY